MSNDGTHFWRVNGYQMKSTAIFVGVNVAASIPIAFCQQAMAADGTQLSGTADFLKSSLAKNSDQATAKSMLAGEPTFSSSRRQLRIKRDLTPTEVISSPRAMAARNTLAPINGIKLRPFVANRTLPSKADLESGLGGTMAAHFDSGSDPSNLSAAVSENNYMTPQVGQEYPNPAYGDYRPGDQRIVNRARLKEAARIASGYDRRSASRSLPNVLPSTPGQVGVPCAQQAVQELHPARKGSLSEWGQLAADIKSGNFDPAMQAEAAKLAANNGADMEPKQTGTAGPAPFPLSLLPEASLKQFIGTTQAPGKRPAPGAPSYFGSWKGSGSIASGKPALQPCGFHSNLGGAGFHSNIQAHIISSSAFKSYAPMAMSNHRVMPVQPSEFSAGKHIAQNVHASSSVNVATYGPYTSGHVTY